MMQWAFATGRPIGSIGKEMTDKIDRNNPGAFHEYLGEGSFGRFLGVWSTMVTAVFAFLGTELIGVTV